MSNKQEIRKIVRQLERAEGWAVRPSGGGHWRATGPDKALLFFPQTPSDNRSINNLIAALKRCGLSVRL